MNQVGQNTSAGKQLSDDEIRFLERRLKPTKPVPHKPVRRSVNSTDNASPEKEVK
jgi:hypothetical protein